MRTVPWLGAHAWASGEFPRSFVLVVLVFAFAFPVATASSALAQNRVGLLGSGLGCQWATVGAAIGAASAATPSTILIQAGHTFNERLGTISKPVTIASSNAGCTAKVSSGAKARIDAGGVGRVATISDAVTFEYVELQGGAVTDEKGAGLLVTSTGDLILDATNLTGGVLTLTLWHLTDLNAAGIQLEAGGTLVMQGNSGLFLNQAVSGWGSGGLVVEAGATATLRDNAKIGALLLANIGHDVAGGALVRGTLILEDDASIFGNSAGLTGGVQVYGGTLELRDRARIAANSGRRAGGVLAYFGAHVFTAEGATPAILDDNGGVDGGGLTIQDATAELEGIEVSDNASDSCGAGILIEHESASLTLENAQIRDNRADTCGGGIAVLEGELDLETSDLTGNIAGKDGGGTLPRGSRQHRRPGGVARERRLGRCARRRHRAALWRLVDAHRCRRA